MRAVLAFLFLLVATTLALAEERIENFISDVTVNADGSLDVRETITVRAEGNEIKRGILRDFPTTYRDRLGNRVRVGFEVLSVRRDGRDETFAIESMSNGKRIQIGHPDVFLNYGSHSYEITYRTTRQLGFFEDFDELYWNVTGNGWTYAIDLASVIIRLPRGAQIKQSAAYTGPQGASGTDFRILSSSGGDFRAETTRRLGPGEGFTVAVAWQKGIVAPPTATEDFNNWLWDNLGRFLLGLTVLGAAAYYLYAWNRVGRDPPQGTIIPLFAPIALVSGAGVALATLWLFAAFTSGPMALALPIVMAYPATTLLIAALWGAPPTVLHLALAGVVMAGALIAAFGGDETEKADASRRRCITFALLAHAGFAAATMLGQHAATLIGAADATFLSRTGGTLLILPVFFLTAGPRGIAPKWLPLLMLMGVLDTGAVLAVNHAGTLPHPQLAIVAASTATIVTVLLARVVLSEAITLLRWFGIVMAVTGVALLAVTR